MECAKRTIYRLEVQIGDRYSLGEREILPNNMTEKISLRWNQFQFRDSLSDLIVKQPLGWRTPKKFRLLKSYGMFNKSQTLEPMVLQLLLSIGRYREDSQATWSLNKLSPINLSPKKVHIMHSGHNKHTLPSCKGIQQAHRPYQPSARIAWCSRFNCQQLGRYNQLNSQLN